MKRIRVFPNRQAAVPTVGDHIIQWCDEHSGAGLGGATGRSPIPVWEWIWNRLEKERPAIRDGVLNNDVVFLDEYFARRNYFDWAWSHLRVGRGGFHHDRIFLPRGCFYENHRLVTGDRLKDILEEQPEDWSAHTLSGENDSPPPEIRIRQNAEHPVLAEVRDALNEYDDIVGQHGQRLQLLGIGVGGAIEHDPEAGGHIGFLEYGSAARDTGTTLVRLAQSTLAANRSDFELQNEDGEVLLEPSEFAVTQGISSLLDHTGELILLAWGQSKRRAIERLFATPGPKNPAAWIQDHPRVTIYLDTAAYGSLRTSELEDRNWLVEFAEADLVRQAGS